MKLVSNLKILNKDEIERIFLFKEIIIFKSIYAYVNVFNFVLSALFLLRKCYAKFFVYYSILLPISYKTII